MSDESLHVPYTVSCPDILLAWWSPMPSIPVVVDFIMSCGTKSSNIRTAFSLAYLHVPVRHVGPTSLQYRIFFDVGNGDNPKALLWLQAPPTPCLGRTLTWVTYCHVALCPCMITVGVRMVRLLYMYMYFLTDYFLFPVWNHAPCMPRRCTTFMYLLYLCARTHRWISLWIWWWEFILSDVWRRRRPLWL